MEELYGKFFSTMHQFQKLRIGDMFPRMTKMDGMTLMSIEHFNKKKEKGIITISELASEMHVQSSAVSRTLKSLEDKGYIVRTINKSDRRNTYVELTEPGRSMLKEAEEIMNSFAKAVITRMDEEDMNRLIAYLDELYHVSKEEIENHRYKDRKENEHE